MVHSRVALVIARRHDLHHGLAFVALHKFLGVALELGRQQRGRVVRVLFKVAVPLP